MAADLTRAAFTATAAALFGDQKPGAEFAKLIAEMLGE